MAKSGSMPSAKIPLTTDKQVEALLKKTAKGVVTETTKKAKKWLTYYTKKNLYGKSLATDVKVRGKYVPIKNHTYKRTNDFINSITIQGTSNDSGNFDNRVYFNGDEMSYGEKNRYALGAHVDIWSNFVGDEDYPMWLEDGTDSGIIKRKGAHMLSDTIKSVEEFLSGVGVDATIFSEVGDVVIYKTN